MSLLLDTHALLWWLADDPELSTEVRSRIGEGRTRVVASAASAWEISIKAARGRLEAPDELAAALERDHIEQLPITVRHATAAGKLPRHHDDPFDRMLIAQAQLEGLALVTRDPRMRTYDVDVVTT